MSKRNWIRRPAPDTPYAACDVDYHRQTGREYVTVPPAIPTDIREGQVATVMLLAMRREGLAPPAPVLDDEAMPF